MADRRNPVQKRHAEWQRAAVAVSKTPNIGRLACRQGFTFTPAQAADSGISHADARRHVRRKNWSVPRRGVLSPLPPTSARDPHQPSGNAPPVRAAAAALVRRDAVVSHEYAAIAHGVDVLAVPRPVTLTTCGRRFSGADGGAVIRAAWLDEDEVTQWYGVRVTTAARSVVDIARSGMRSGLVAVESALTWGVVTREELAAAIARQHHWHGVKTAREVLDLAGHGSESPLESLTRLFCHERGIPLPDQQQWIETHLGWFRVDGLWKVGRVVLEVDGMIKYRQPRNADEDPLDAEKIRQEAIEAAGYVVIRVSWADLHSWPELTEARIRRVLRAHAVA